MRRWQVSATDEPVRGPTATTAGFVNMGQGGVGPAKAAVLQWNDALTEGVTMAAIDRLIAYLESDGRDHQAGFGVPLP